jgi:hypothetical protein
MSISLWHNVIIQPDLLLQFYRTGPGVRADLYLVQDRLSGSTM